ncbi:elongation factor Ts, mitochondrial [Dermacentor andersoni]|uniref:elongation factor Ts, mitochondrial n=1 Tax=Dermacentor andersoni TaxID=34620 RepID=UPI002155A2F0|nr:elongation factor Ts, mitochondrial-like [Dermacentor andersoni]XP_054922909.1 elongation factor Ts, mitochondrial-like [Dermacentor andersoni]XP_054922910.1 elongation factor Ts, mitochondrial-like [Dermacentor andersoni]
MFAQVLTRCLQTSASLRAVEKTALMELRKKTGYTFTNCKKALEATNNDIKKAEKWLADEAKKYGWAKATQMQGRQTMQGLVAINVDGPFAAMAEVNCETDFVARTPEFQTFVEQLVRSCTSHAKKLPSLETSIMKVRLGTKELEKLRIKDGHTVEEARALAIGKLGEQLAVRRALCLRGEAGTTLLAGYCHPQNNQNATKKYPCFGRYGAVVAYRDLGDSPLSEDEMEELGRRLCQQVVALNPKSIGLLDDYLLFEKEEEKRIKEQEEKEKKAKEEVGEKKEPEGSQAAEDNTPVSEEEEQPPMEEEEEEESRLLFQDYVVDPTIKVGHMVAESRIDIMDFERYGCGESTEKNE